MKNNNENDEIIIIWSIMKNNDNNDVKWKIMINNEKWNMNNEMKKWKWK